MINTINFENFTDLKTLTIDKTNPLDKRLKQYVKDVKNPYKVRVGDILVQIEFTGGKSFSSVLASGIQL